MKRATFFFQVLVVFLSWIGAIAQDKNQMIHEEVFEKWTMASFSRSSKWVYKPGNNPDWSRPDLSTDDWQPVDILLEGKHMPETWKGSGWFRTKISIDTALFNREMAIQGNINGALECYINGYLIGTAGKLGTSAEDEEAVSFFEPARFTFSGQEEQTCAIRYTNFSVEQSWHRSFTGLNLYIGYPDKIDKSYASIVDGWQRQTNRFCFIFGIMVALGLLHLILFAYYPAEQANLLCSLFSFSISILFLGGILFPYYGIPELHIYGEFLDGSSLTLTGIVLPFFVYKVIRRKIDWVPLAMLSIGAVLLVFHIMNKTGHSNIYYFFFLLSSCVGIGYTVYARVKLKMHDLNIVLLFYIVSLILVFPGLILAVFGYSILWARELIFMNVAAIPAAFGYSFYLARGVAVTNRRLREKLTENEILSNEKLRAEIEKQHLIENQRKILEQEVAERTVELSNSLQTLKATQAQLIQQEKLASLGELTSGIAHEIQNPLNFVNNFSEVTSELMVEMRDELDKGDLDEARAIASSIEQNLEKITHHGKRADNIVKGMLLHSRNSTGIKEPTDINVLADEYLRLAYHGLRAKDKSFNADFHTDLDSTLPKLEVVPQDIGRVLLNLINNAFYACNQKAVHLANSEQQIANSQSPVASSQQTAGTDMPVVEHVETSGTSTGSGTGRFKPTVTVTTKNLGTTIEIRVQDNGNGIPKEVLDKIFQPFFTTKPTGQGTGLGLSLSYDIVKAHGGELRATTKEGEGSRFILTLPA